MTAADRMPVIALELSHRLVAAQESGGGRPDPARREERDLVGPDAAGRLGPSGDLAELVVGHLDQSPFVLGEADDEGGDRQSVEIVLPSRGELLLDPARTRRPLGRRGRAGRRPLPGHARCCSLHRPTLGASWLSVD
jgi:hypothetical protein